MNSAASLDKYRAAAATSEGWQKRPRGLVDWNLARFSGVSGDPLTNSNIPVTTMTGQLALTRILSGPSSTAIDLDSRFTAPFAAMYQVRPGDRQSTRMNSTNTCA